MREPRASLKKLSAAPIWCERRIQVSNERADVNAWCRRLCCCELTRVYRCLSSRRGGLSCGKGRVSFSHGSVTDQIHPKSGGKSTLLISWLTQRQPCEQRGCSRGTGLLSIPAGTGQDLAAQSSKDPPLLLTSRLLPILHPSLCTSC